MIEGLPPSAHARTDRTRAVLEHGLRWYVVACFFAVCLILIGFRDYAVGADTIRYVRAFSWLPTAPYNVILATYQGSDVGFYLLSRVLVSALGVRGALVAYSVLLAAAVVYVSHAADRRNVILIVVLYLSLPALYSLGSNVIRHGVSVSFLLIGTAFLLKGRLLAAVLCSGLAVLMHASAVIYIVACIVALTMSMRMLITAAAIAALAAVVGGGLHHIDGLLGIDAVGMLVGDRFDIYMQWSGHRYRTGFRFDFFLYSAVPVVLVWLTTKGKITELSKYAPNKSLLLKVYLALSVAFFLSFSYPYSDRVGVFSWILIPIIVGMNEKGEVRGGVYSTVRAVGIIVIVSVNLYLLALA